ncbi:hypothetical protein V8C35DRAFT_293807 [Trichoderma chlorosporum]
MLHTLCGVVSAEQCSVFYTKFRKDFELFCIEPGPCGSLVGTRLSHPWSLRLRTLTPSTEGAKKGVMVSSWVHICTFFVLSIRSTAA